MSTKVQDMEVTELTVIQQSKPLETLSLQQISSTLLDYSTTSLNFLFPDLINKPDFLQILKFIAVKTKNKQLISEINHSLDNWIADEAQPNLMLQLEANALRSAIRLNLDQLAADILELTEQNISESLVKKAIDKGLVQFLVKAFEKIKQDQKYQGSQTGILKEMSVADRQRRNIVKYLSENAEKNVLQAFCAKHCQDQLVMSVLMETDQFEMIEFLLESNKIKLLRPIVAFLLNNSKLLIIIKAVKSHPSKNLKCNKFLSDSEIIVRIINHLNDPYQTLNAFELLGMWKKSQSDPLTLYFLFKVLYKIALPIDSKQSLLANVCNPLRICVLASELCNQVGSWNDNLVYKFQSLQDNFITIANLFQNHYIEVIKLANLYNEPIDSEGTCLLEVVASQPMIYRSLLNHELVNQVAECIWYNGGLNPLNFQKFNLIRKLLKQFYKSGKIDFEKVSFVKNEKGLFTYQSWIHQPYTQYIAETIYMVSVFFYLMYVVVTYVQFMLDKDRMNDNSENMDDMDSMDDEMDQINFYFSIGMLLSGTQVLSILQKFLLKYMVREPIQLQVSVILDLLMAFPCFIIAYQQIFQKPEERDRQIAEYVFGTLMFALCLRIITVFLMLFASIGAISRMFVHILNEIIPFLAILFLIIITFSIFYHILFYDQHHNFETLSMTFRTLFDFTIGNVDFGLFEEEVGFSVWMTVFYALIIPIIIMNILIAILNDVYAKLSPKPRADQLSMIYMHWKQNRYIEDYGGFVFCVAPLNLLFIPLIPLYFTNCRKWLDKVVCKISYAPWCLIGAFLYFFMNVYYMFYAYIMVGWYFIAHSDYNAVKKLGSLASWIILGPWLMLFLVAYSFKYYFQEYIHLQPEPEMNSVSDQVIQSTYEFLQELCDEISYGEEITLKQITAKLQSLNQQHLVKNFPNLPISGMYQQLAILVQKEVERFHLMKGWNEMEILDLIMQFSENQIYMDESKVDVYKTLAMMERFNAKQLFSLNIAGIIFSIKVNRNLIISKVKHSLMDQLGFN